jgi:hypothetical protein
MVNGQNVIWNSKKELYTNNEHSGILHKYIEDCIGKSTASVNYLIPPL